MRKPASFIAEYFFHEYHSPLMEAKLYRKQMSSLAKSAKEEKLETGLCSPRELNELFRINIILWQWDPFHVNHLSTIDEYLSFVPGLLELKRMGAGRDAIVKKLFEIDCICHPTPAQLKECRKVAEKIMISG